MKRAQDAASRPPSREEGWFPALLRVGVYATAAAVFAWPLAVTEAVVTAAVGAAAGALIGRALARSHVRLGFVLGGSAAALGAVALLDSLVIGTQAFAPSMGPSAALRLGDAVTFGLGALVVAIAVRFVTLRLRSLAVLEVAFVAGAFAQLVVAHRNGAINRPFEIADPILARGGDPAVAMLAVGAAATVVVVLVLLSERSWLRSIVHLAIVALLLLLVLGTTRMLGLPPPPATGAGLGLRSDDSGNQQRQRGQRGGSRSGRRNNDDLEFRDDYQSSANQVPVAVVLLHDDYSPPTGLYYFREGAFSQYNGRRLVASTRPDTDQDIAPSFPSQVVPVVGAPVAGRDRALLDTTVALLADHTRPFGLESPVSMQPAPNPDPSRFRRTYKVTSAALTSDFRALIGRPAGDASWTAEQRAHYTTAPSDPRYAELATRIVATLPERLRADPMARALAITSWLGKEGTYSLRSRHANAEDPTAHFLFGDKTGYCVHFAHAAAYLMRAAGLPSRVATGYVIEESARQGGSALLLSGQNSHAWAETYLDGTGWIVVDVSPERVLDPPPQPPDPDLQRLLAQMVREEQFMPPDGRPPPPPIETTVKQAGAAMGYVSGGLLLTALLLLFLVKLWRRIAPVLAPARAMPRVAYRAELDRLAEAQLRRDRGESREAFALRVASIAPSFVVLTRRHVGAAFGTREALDARDLRSVARRVRSELATAVPLRKRVLGAIVPWSWLTSR